MKKFIVIYYAPAEAMEQMKDMTPEEAEEGGKQWAAWMELCGEGLVDLGNPMGNGLRVTPGGKSGPSGKDIAGYSILQAADMEAAKALVESHPFLQWGEESAIEIYEAFPFPGME